MKKKPQKNSFKFYCEKCDFLSSNKKDYNRHLLTRKHNKDNKDKKWITKITKLCPGIFLRHKIFLITKEYLFICIAIKFKKLKYKLISHIHI